MSHQPIGDLSACEVGDSSKGMALLDSAIAALEPAHGGKLSPIMQLEKEAASVGLPTHDGPSLVDGVTGLDRLEPDLVRPGLDSGRPSVRPNTSVVDLETLGPDPTKAAGNPLSVGVGSNGVVVDMLGDKNCNEGRSGFNSEDLFLGVPGADLGSIGSLLLGCDHLFQVLVRSY